MIDILSFAGTATTYRATHAFVAILTNSPQLQKRLQREVDEAIGEEVPRLADKEKMPYMEAVRFEIFPLLNIFFMQTLTLSFIYLFHCRQYMNYSDTSVIRRCWYHTLP